MRLSHPTPLLPIHAPIAKHIFLDPYQAKLEKAKAENSEVVARRLVELKKSVAPPAAPVVEEKKPDWAKAQADEPPAPAPTPAPAPVAAASGSKSKFSYEALKAGIPAGVDPTLKETYLEDGEFRQIFGVEPAAFAALPKWKRDEQKKKVGLF